MIAMALLVHLIRVSFPNSKTVQSYSNAKTKVSYMMGN